MMEVLPCDALRDSDLDTGTPMHNVTVRFPAALTRRLDNAAKGDRRTRSEWLRMFLNDHLPPEGAPHDHTMDQDAKDPTE